MKKLIILLLTLQLFGCQKAISNQELREQIDVLKSKNDSLTSILVTVKDKYIFDSIAIREIPFYGNTYKQGSVAKGEIVFVGFNLDNSAKVIIGDSISILEQKVFNPDTLDLRKGGFSYEIKLNEQKNFIYGILDIKSKYGRDYNGHYSTGILAN